MAFNRLEFTKRWTNSADFPTLETDETKVREDMQLLHDESKNALNALMEALETGGKDVLVRFGSDEVRYIRMNKSGGLEVSSDGVDYSVVSTGSAGGAAPATHASQHKAGGSDPIKAADIGAQPAVTGAATTITGSNLTANRALVSNSSGKVAVSDVTATELGYLDGVTSGIQNQINGKAASGHKHTAADVGAFSTGNNLSMDNSDPIMYPSTASKATRIRMYSGRNATFNGGAGLILTNKDSTGGDAGNFSLTAHNGTESAAFTGKPDGTLTWRGNSILHAGNISSYALPLDGSVQMKGNINIKKGDSPAIKFENTDTNREMWFLLSSNDNNISISNRIDNDHRTLLIVSPETVAAVNLLRLYHVNGSGSGKFYNVFHTGNVTAGTTDLTAGSSALTTDAIYQVYE